MLCQLQSMSMKTLTGSRTRNVCMERVQLFQTYEYPSSFLLSSGKAGTGFVSFTTRNVCISPSYSCTHRSPSDGVTFRRLCIPSEINRWPDHNSVIRSRQISKLRHANGDAKREPERVTSLLALRAPLHCRFRAAERYNIRTLRIRFFHEGLVLVVVVVVLKIKK